MWALYTSATDVYDHAVLGDALEGYQLTVLQWNPETELVEWHSNTGLEDVPQSDAVFEGLGPMWTDIDQDGIDDFDDDCVDEPFDEYKGVWLDHPIRMEQEHFYANATDDPKIGEGMWVLLPSEGSNNTSYCFVSLAVILIITITLIGCFP